MKELNSLIRELLAEYPGEHPHKLARIVAERTPVDELQACYAAALEPLICDVIRASRNATLNSKAGKSTGSAKVERRRSWWRQLLAERVHVGRSVYKTIGECGADELEFCISERREQIGALMGQIAKFEAIRAAVVLHGVDTVAELPEDAVTL